jgi:hypothetical protein
MSFEALTADQIAAGSPADQVLFQKIKDDLDFLYGQIGSLPNSLPNGSFEVDSDADGIPDGGTPNTYAGGSIAIDESSPLHGKRALRITSPGGSGNGGGYWDFDYIEVSSFLSLAVSLLHLSSVSGIHNLVEVRWFDKDKVALTGGDVSTTLYDSAANPTTASYLSASAVPPTGARFAKVRLTGAKNDNTTAGYAVFDCVHAGFQRVDTVAGKGYASFAYSAGEPDRIHIDGSLASPTPIVLQGVCGVATGIIGGRDVTVDYRNSSSSAVSLDLTLPPGKWTITATGFCKAESETTIYSTLTALAIREI